VLDLHLQMFDPEAMIQAIRDEMVQMGFRELRTPEEVEEAFRNAAGSSLVFVNSVCGCAGGIARPAVRYALEKGLVKPDHLFTVFAGQDKEATARARELFGDYPPSSPSIALLRDGQCVAMIHRSDIEGREPLAVVGRLQELWQQHFGAPVDQG